jgi:hypothetical protein
VKKTPGRTVPAFVSESQEAEWWHKNRRTLDADFQKAARRGELKPLDRKTLLGRIAASSRVVSIRFPEAGPTQAK